MTHTATKGGLFACAILLAGASATPGMAQQEAHVHGISEIDLVIDGTTVALAFRAPGSDIVGFEHAADTPEDKHSVEQAVATLKGGTALFLFPEAAECTLAATDVDAIGYGDHDHDDHDHGDAHKDDDDHDGHGDHGDHDDDHAKAGHGDEGHDDDHKGEHGHDDDDHKGEHAHDDDHKGEHAHDDDHKGEHAHDEDGDGETHAEFQASYQFTCAHPEAVTGLTTAVFDQFAGAAQIRVQAITPTGQHAGTLTADRPGLDF